MSNTILAAILVIVVVTLILVALLLFIKIKLTPSGTVKIDINDGKKVLDVPQGGSLLNTLAEQKIFLPSACGAWTVMVMKSFLLVSSFLPCLFISLHPLPD